MFIIALSKSDSTFTKCNYLNYNQNELNEKIMPDKNKIEYQDILRIIDQYFKDDSINDS